MRGAEWRVCDRDFGMCYQFAAILPRLYDGSGGYDYLLPTQLAIKKLEESAPIEPAFEMDKESCQSLMDALYRAGFRPRDAQPQDATITAMSYHLEDMRKLVFSELRK